MKHRSRGFSIGPFFFLAACVLVLTLGSGQSIAQDTFSCVTGDKMEKEISPGAELAEFACFFDRYEGKEVLHFKVGVKNTGDTPQRFRINIFLDNGKAVGGLLPRTTKGGLVEPDKTASFVYPVTGMTEKPESVMVRVSVSGP